MIWSLWISLLLLALATALPTDTTERPLKPRDVNKTISKVEALLKKNPDLPRLTRGEILSLLDNITKVDAEKNVKQQALDSFVDGKTRTEYERALMVVLPFQADSNGNSSGELQELYTKFPITKLVVEEVTTMKTPTPTKRTRRKNHARRKPAKQEEASTQELRPVYKPQRKLNTTTSTTTTTTESWRPYTGMELRYPQPFGYHDDSKQNVQSDIGVPEEMKQTLMDIGIPQNHKPDTLFVTPMKIVSSTTTTSRPSTSKPAPIPDISLAVQSLTPEMRDLLISFGLVKPDGTPVKSENKTPPASLFEYKPISPTVDPTSYVSFKPLPTSRGAQQGYDDINNEMKSFLASFGLMSDAPSHRSQKALNTSQTEAPKVETTTKFSISNINPDILNDDMRGVLENLGLMKTSRKAKEHIFNPSLSVDLQKQSDDSEKINKLLGTLKQLKEAERNHSLSEEEVAAKLENITSSLTTDGNSSDSEELVQTEGSEITYDGYEPAEEELLKLQNGIFDSDLEDNNDNSTQDSSSNTLQQTSAPDPLEELSEIPDTFKNEVKRQQPNDTSADTDGTTESPSSKDSSPSLTDLEESFGGDNPTTSRPNGLYFLVDWNTFLRVGTDNTTVDLNFAPKVGDPKNFLPVTVP